MIVAEVVEGWTDPLEFQLSADGSSIDLVGSTVTLYLYGNDGTQVDTTGGKITIADALTGKVKFYPASSDLKALLSPYHARWKVDPAGIFIPSEDGEDLWKVNPVLTIPEISSTSFTVGQLASLKANYAQGVLRVLYDQNGRKEVWFRSLDEMAQLISQIEGTITGKDTAASQRFSLGAHHRG